MVSLNNKWESTATILQFCSEHQCWSMHRRFYLWRERKQLNIGILGHEFMVKELASIEYTILR